jgi:hypothetical protein
VAGLGLEPCINGRVVALGAFTSACTSRPSLSGYWASRWKTLRALRVLRWYEPASSPGKSNWPGHSGDC